MFDRALAEQFAYRRKRAGHLWSKQRFLAAQWLALLTDDLWLPNAEHANTMAVSSMADSPIVLTLLPWPVEANDSSPSYPRHCASR